jgi:transcriptional regulator with PAS, ATPase and Fis domain
MKILVSFLSKNNDFVKGQNAVNTEGPTYLFHQHFFKDYDKHLLLSSAKEDDTAFEFLLNKLRNDFKTHTIEEKYLGITDDDLVNYNVVKGKLEKLLLSLSDHEIDIFFSPGTSAMQVSWFLCHTTLKLKTKLLQTRSPKHTKDKKPELLEIRTSQSTTTAASVIKEITLDAKDDKDKNYNITPSIKPVFEKAFKIAQTDNVTTIIRGDSGTGKEYLAKYIHENSARKNKPFKAINCSAMSDDLLESRLFGHKEGSFTGAIKDQAGLFEQAEGGTIFLDEIGDVSPYMQQVLLRVLQEKEIEPIGSSKSKKVDVRIITATHRQLEKLCADEKFRWDLYYRLVVAELELPSLHARGQDELKEMISFLLKEKKRKFKRSSALKLSKAALQQLLQYPYPGNIRELENLIETLYVYNDDEVNSTNLPQRITSPPEEVALNWQAVEKKHIIKLLKMFKGNQRQAAKAIGYSIGTFSTRIKDYEIDIEDFAKQP